MKREEALDVALGQIERQFGKGSVMVGSDHDAVGRGRDDSRRLVASVRRAGSRCRTTRRLGIAARRQGSRPGTLGATQLGATLRRR